MVGVPNINLVINDLTLLIVVGTALVVGGIGGGLKFYNSTSHGDSDFFLYSMHMTGHKSL